MGDPRPGPAWPRGYTFWAPPRVSSAGKVRGPRAPGTGAGLPPTRQTGRGTGARSGGAVPRGPLGEGHTTPAAQVFREKSCFSYQRKTNGIYGGTCFWVCKDSRPVWHLCLARKWLHFSPQEHAVSSKFSKAPCTIAKATDQDADTLGIPSRCLGPQTHTGAYWGPTSLPSFPLFVLGAWAAPEKPDIQIPHHRAAVS